VKRALLAGLAAVTLVAAQPASAETATYGPGTSGVSPAYTLPIHVIDGVRGTLREDRRREWTVQLHRALDGWGLPYYVTRRAESAQTFIATDVNISTYGIDPLVVPDAVVLVRGRFAQINDSAGYSDLTGGGAAILTPWRGWWSGPNGAVSMIAHEVGHTIGFQHGGTGVMWGAFRVNDEERALAQTYYGLSS
jgi:hypothetical protein